MRTRGPGSSQTRRIPAPRADVPPRRVRVGLLLGSGCTLTSGIGLCRVLVGLVARVREPTPTMPGEALTLAAAIGALALGAWLSASVLVCVVARAPGVVGSVAGHVRDACTPLLARRVAAVLLGVAITGAAAPGASAVRSLPGGTGAPGSSSYVADVSPARSSGLGHVDRVSTSVGDPTEGATPGPGWRPTRPRPPGTPHGSGLLSPAPVPPSADVVVRRGDTLWSIARRHLRPDCTDAEVAAAWPRWYDANRSVIGADPDRILPGQVLQAPRDPADAGGRA